MEILWIGLAFLIGVAGPLQTGVNMSLTHNWSHHMLLTCMVSSLVTSTVLFLSMLVLRVPLPAFRLMPLWQYTGGILGASMLLGMLYVGPKVGAAALVALLIAGQVTAAVLFDHFGLLGFSVRSINLPRVIGLLLIGGGVFLVRRF